MHPLSNPDVLLGSAFSAKSFGEMYVEIIHNQKYAYKLYNIIISPT